MSKKSKNKLTKYEIDKIIEDAWLNIHVDETKIGNPLESIPIELEDNPHLYFLWIMQQPEYFHFFCSQILNLKLLPLQSVILQEIWKRKFPMLIASRGAGKSWLLAVYCILRALFIPGRKIVVCGAAFRQSKIILEYMEAIWKNAPILRDLCSNVANTQVGLRRDIDMYKFHINDSLIMGIPVGTGETIRGLRANDIITDEFASLSREIFERVISGFASVRAQPVDMVRELASRAAAKELGVDLEAEELDLFNTNQIVITGTAYYDFSHFSEYHRKWCQIIRSGGDEKKLREVYPDGLPEDFNWRDYSVIRIPFELLPKGFMDEGIIARARATVHSGIYEMEFGSVFSKDSHGFFKRSLIEYATASRSNPIILPSGVVKFHHMIRGNPQYRYVYGVDPASESDNFSIIVLELHKDHRRIVYGWTTTRHKHREAVSKGVIKENDYYRYCVKKIRSLMKTFPCERIMLDSQGGGITILEGLHDKTNMEEGEQAIWSVIIPGESQSTDGEAGLHLVELVKFASFDWVAAANHSLKKDFEDRVCIFPYFDAATLGLAEMADSINYSSDSFEDCVLEIEELKNELTTIVITRTASGNRDRWDTPEVKLAGNKKGRLRKDRYSALLMANMGARQLLLNPQKERTLCVGGFAVPQSYDKEEEYNGPFYQGPTWFSDKMRGVYD